MFFRHVSDDFKKQSPAHMFHDISLSLPFGAALPLSRMMMQCSMTAGSPLPPPTEASSVILSPCAACKILRRRCGEKCLLAPYFPPTEPLKFTTAHRVFGAGNIIKILKDLPEHRREDAVSSMVYEAQARIRDPVYGCAGVICQLQNQVSELQAEVAKARAELVAMQLQQANLVTFIRGSIPLETTSSDDPFYENRSPFPASSPGSDEGSWWDPLWTSFDDNCSTNQMF